MKMEKSCWGKEEGVLGLGTLQRKKIQKIRDYYGSGWVGPGLTRNFFVENRTKIALNQY